MIAFAALASAQVLFSYACTAYKVKVSLLSNDKDSLEFMIALVSQLHVHVHVTSMSTSHELCFQSHDKGLAMFPQIR